MFDNPPEPRNVLGDSIVRGGIGLAFVYFGAEKFPSDPGSEWVNLFQQIGAGQWFRYFTGVVEILGGVLVLIPWTTTIGLVLLACTMAAAAIIVAFVIGRPAHSVISGAFFIGLSLYLLARRSR